MDTSPRRSRNSGAYVGAAILIVIGVLALIANLGGPQITGDVIPLAIGLAFLVAYAFTRHYGYLVPGGIVTGVGAGLWVASAIGMSDKGPYTLIGGGLGFLLIYALDVARRGVAAHWWPILPGALMVVAGAGVAVQNEAWVQQIANWSPLLLILLGIWLIVARGRQPSH